MCRNNRNIKMGFHCKTLSYCFILSAFFIFSGCYPTKTVVGSQNIAVVSGKKLDQHLVNVKNNTLVLIHSIADARKLSYPSNHRAIGTVCNYAGEMSFAEPRGVAKKYALYLNRITEDCSALRFVHLPIGKNDFCDKHESGVVFWMKAEITEFRSGWVCNAWNYDVIGVVEIDITLADSNNIVFHDVIRSELNRGLFWGVSVTDQLDILEQTKTQIVLELIKNKEFQHLVSTSNIFTSEEIRKIDYAGAFGYNNNDNLVRDNQEKKPCQNSQGSGFLISEDGFVVTNYHVVDNKSDYNVVFPKQNKKYSGQILMKDKNNDLVILKLNNFNYKEIFNQKIPFPFKKSKDAKLGEPVFTLGFPLGGVLGKSAKFSTGNISSLVGIEDNASVFQISNPVQPGNSGGPLFDGSGSLIGIVVGKLSDIYTIKVHGAIPQNVNFAIKSDYLINLISMLPKAEFVLDRKGRLSGLKLQEQVEALIPYVVTVYAGCPH